MRKDLEVIEAKWLFGLKPEQIDVICSSAKYHSFPDSIYGWKYKYIGFTGYETAHSICINVS